MTADLLPICMQLQKVPLNLSCIDKGNSDVTKLLYESSVTCPSTCRRFSLIMTHLKMHYRMWNQKSMLWLINKIFFIVLITCIHFLGFILAILKLHWLCALTDSLNLTFCEFCSNRPTAFLRRCLVTFLWQQKQIISVSYENYNLKLNDSPEQIRQNPQSNKEVQESSFWLRYFG